MLVKELILNVHVFGLLWGETVHEADDDEIVGVRREIGQVLECGFELVDLKLFVFDGQVATDEEVLLVLVDDGETVGDEPRGGEDDEE